MLAAGVLKSREIREAARREIGESSPTGKKKGDWSTHELFDAVWKDVYFKSERNRLSRLLQVTLKREKSNTCGCGGQLHLVFCNSFFLLIFVRARKEIKEENFLVLQVSRLYLFNFHSFLFSLVVLSPPITGIKFAFLLFHGNVITVICRGPTLYRTNVESLW